MATWNPFYRRDENTRTCWGYTFQLTPEHLTPEEATPLRYSYDVLGAECLDILNEISPPESKAVVKEAEAPLLKDGPPAIQPKSAPGSEKSAPTPTPLTTTTTTTTTPSYKKPKRDLYQILEARRHEHPKLLELWNEVTTTPSWVDWAQISRGQDVFYRYGGANLTGLTYQALLGGMGANRIVEVLARTGGFSVNVARHRLFETTQHILECTRSLESIQPGGAGFASSIRVRLLHAAVRNRILKLAKSHPSYYNIQEFGTPINDLDQIGTIGTFSATLLYLSLPRQGITPTAQECEDYLALWRLIALYTGTPHTYFATTTRARAIMQSLLMSEINPSQLSGTLANNIIRCLENTPPAYASRSFLTVSARWLNGNELCDALQLPTVAPHYWLLIIGQCLFFASLTHIYRFLSLFSDSYDRAHIERVKKLLWDVIVEGKHGLKGDKTTFEFKWVPELGALDKTERGVGKEVRVDGGRRDVEWRSFKTLVMGLVGVGVVGWVGVTGVRAMGGVVGRLL